MDSELKARVDELTIMNVTAMMALEQLIGIVATIAPAAIDASLRAARLQVQEIEAGRLPNRGETALKAQQSLRNLFERALSD
jgi:hypothetical protein